MAKLRSRENIVFYSMYFHEITVCVISWLSSYAWFDIIAGKESGVSIHNSFPPAVVILLDDVDNRAFVECEFVVFVLLVTVDRHHCTSTAYTRGSINSFYSHMIPMVLKQKFFTDWMPFPPLNQSIKDLKHFKTDGT